MWDTVTEAFLNCKMHVSEISFYLFAKFSYIWFQHLKYSHQYKIILKWCIIWRTLKKGYFLAYQPVVLFGSRHSNSPNFLIFQADISDTSTYTCNKLVPRSRFCFLHNQMTVPGLLHTTEKSLKFCDAVHKQNIKVVQIWKFNFYKCNLSSRRYS